MSIYIGVYAISQLKELVIMLSNSFVLKKNSDAIPYFSNLFSKLSLSTEILLSITNTQDKYKQYKNIVLIIFEILRTYFKLKEWQQLSKKGINFHLSEEIYFSEVIPYTNEDFNGKLLEG